MLHNVLAGNTAAVFDALAGKDRLKHLTLIGGTALALKIGHRISADLDLASFTGKLPAHDIDRVMAQLQDEGHDVRMVSDPGQISRHRINTGENLLDYARDYVIDGTKVTFFAHGKTKAQRVFYTETGKWSPAGCKFNILGLEGLKVAKTLILEDRVKSRDLFDLMILMKDHGLTLDEAFQTIEKLGVNRDTEQMKLILRGVVPVQQDDEGLMPVGVPSSLPRIYQYFSRIIASQEAAFADRLFKPPG